MRFVLIVAVLFCVSGYLAAQPIIPPGVIDELNNEIGGEVETLAILGGESAFSGGFYNSDVDDTNIDLTKVAFKFELWEPNPIGESRWKWSPVIQGAFGYISDEAVFETGPLIGNGLNSETYVGQLGGGGRFYVNDYISSATTLGLIYSHNSEEFTANNPFGQFVKDNFSGILVDLEIDALTITPNVDLRYERLFGGFFKLKLETVYKYYHTFEIESNSPILDFTSSSHTWKNEIDGEFWTPLKLWQGPIKVGASIARTQLWGGVKNTLEDSHIWGTSWRLFWDPNGKAWIFTGIGFGGGHFWSDNVSGSSFGIYIDAKL